MPYCFSRFSVPPLTFPSKSLNLQQALRKPTVDRTSLMNAKLSVVLSASISSALSNPAVTREGKVDFEHYLGMNIAKTALRRASAKLST